MSTIAPYLSPSERYYRGELTREQARDAVLANARRARKTTGSPQLNTILKVVGFIILPLVFLANCFAPRRQ